MTLSYTQNTQLYVFTHSFNIRPATGSYSEPVEANLHFLQNVSLKNNLTLSFHYKQLTKIMKRYIYFYLYSFIYMYTHKLQAVQYTERRNKRID